MKKKTGHQRTLQIRQFAYDTKYKDADIRFFTECVALFMWTFHQVQFILVYVVSRIYQDWLPVIVICMAPIIVWPSPIMYLKSA